MNALNDLGNGITTAMKSGDTARRDALRLLLNRVKAVAKADKNRETNDADVLTAALKMTKESTESRDMFAAGGRDVTALNREIEIVSEFLPRKMSRDALVARITELVGQTSGGKAARGFVMKTLNGEAKGAFDPADANAILADLGC